MTVDLFKPPRLEAAESAANDLRLPSWLNELAAASLNELPKDFYANGLVQLEDGLPGNSATCS